MEIIKNAVEFAVSVFVNGTAEGIQFILSSVFGFLLTITTEVFTMFSRDVHHLTSLQIENYSTFAAICLFGYLTIKSIPLLLAAMYACENYFDNKAQSFDNKATSTLPRIVQKSSSEINTATKVQQVNFTDTTLNKTIKKGN